MARLWHGGAELRSVNVGVELGDRANTTVATTNQRSGDRAWRITSLSSGVARWKTTSTSGGEPDFVLRIKVSASGTVEESSALNGIGSTGYLTSETVTDTHFIQLTAVWLMVDHKPGAAGSTSPSISPSVSLSPSITPVYSHKSGTFRRAKKKLWETEIKYGNSF
jgi:type IV secretory pathway TrbL component